MKDGWFYMIPIFYNCNTKEIKGRNKVYDFMLGVMIWIHVNIINHITGIYDFPIYIRNKK